MNLDLLLAIQNGDFRKAVGARLKELRKQKRWSQKELATKVDIRFQQLNKYESGLNTPPGHHGGLPAHRQSGRGDAARQPPAVPLLPGAEGLDTEDQEAVIKLIDTMIAKQQVHSALSSLGAKAANA